MKFLLEKRKNLSRGFTHTPTLVSRCFVIIHSYYSFFLSNFLRKEEVISQRKTIPRLVSGFTLVELLVTITIFVMLTGVVLFKQNGFDNSILLSNMAYDMGLTLRQAQSFGLSTRETSSGSNKFLVGSGYGMYINKTPGVGSNRNFILFADLNSDNRSGTGCTVSDTECVQKYSINRGNFIQKICLDMACTSIKQTNELSILFKRPKPDALIYWNDGTATLATSSMARIVVSSSDGKATTSIIITSVGQIYVTK